MIIALPDTKIAAQPSNPLTAQADGQSLSLSGPFDPAIFDAAIFDTSRPVGSTAIAIQGVRVNALKS